MKKAFITMLILIVFTSMLLADEHEKEKYIDTFQKIYPEECKSNYIELFNFWADFIIYLNQLDNENEITQQCINSFKNKCTNIDKLIYLEWSINQKYPYETQKIKSWVDLDIPYLLKLDFWKRIPSFTDLFIENSDDRILKSHLLMPISIIGTVIKVENDFSTETLNYTLIKTPITLNIQEVLGNQFEQSSITGYMNSLKLYEDKEIKYQYYPAVGDEVLAKIWIIQTNQKTKFGTEILVDTILEIHQINNGIIYKNYKNIANDNIAGLKSETSLDEYRSYWNRMYTEIIKGDYK